MSEIKWKCPNCKKVNAIQAGAEVESKWYKVNCAWCDLDVEIDITVEIEYEKDGKKIREDI